MRSGLEGDGRDEVACLTRENAALLELNAALKESNAAYKDANAALKDLVTSLQNERAALLGQGLVPASSSAEQPTSIENKDVGGSWNEGERKLPQELLLRIFLATIPADEDYDLSVRVGPRSPWLTSVCTRRALTLVCKAWYGPASEALYSDIALRRMGQISALARTLRSARAIYAPDPSRFIKRIRVAGCIVLGRCAAVVRDDLALILQYASALTAFEHEGPSPNFEMCSEEPSDLDEWYSPAWFCSADEGTPGGALAQRCASGLRHLAFSELNNEHIEYLQHLLHLETDLTALTLGPFLSWTRMTGAMLLQLDAVVLPYLQHLEVHSTLLDLQDYICHLWELPNLQRLTVLSCGSIPHDALACFGTHLKYLHLAPGRYWTGDTAALSDLPALCPALEHLVLADPGALNLPCTLASPTLRHLDIWGPAQKRRVAALMCEIGRACALPALRTVRMLSPRAPAHPSACARLPLLCGPAEVRGDEVRVRMLPGGVRVLQTSWAVFLDTGGGDGDDVRFCNVPFDEEGGDEADDESDYEPPWTEGEEKADGKGEEPAGEEVEDADEVEDDGTSWVSNSDSEGSYGEDENDTRAEDGEDAEAEDPGLYEREVILEMFARSQEEDFLFDSDSD